MSQDLVYKPRVIIDGIEIVYIQTIQLTMRGNSTIHTLSVTCSSHGIRESSLFGKKISLFLNCGSEDGSPIFVGYIKEVNTDEKTLKISALDVRCLLQDSSKPINLTDDENLDGDTLGSFLNKYIKDYINTDGETYINTNMLNDTHPKVTLNGLRGTFTPYQIVQDLLQKTTDSENLQEPLDYSIDVFEDSIYFKKKQSLESTPSLSLSEYNGIKSYTYKERVPKFVGGYDGKIFKYGSNPSGPFSVQSVKTTGEFPAEKRQDVYLDILKELTNTQEITVNANIGHYIDLESIIRLEVEDSNISGPHRVVNKSINYSKGSMNLQLGLNKKRTLLKSYIS